MRTMLLGAVAAATMMAPGLANADVSGSASFTYENNDFDYGENDAWSLGGVVMSDVHGFDFQLDGRTTLMDWDGSGGDDSHGYAAAHVSGDLGGFDLGGFAGIVNYYGDAGVLIGAEARTAFGNISLDGSIAHTDFDYGYDGTAYRVGGAFFFMPNFAVNAGASRTDIDSFGTDFEITELSLGAAWQFANNVEVFGGYTDTDGDRSPGADYDGETVQLGVRLNFNGGTLQDNTNNGAWSSAMHVANTWMRW